MWLSHIFAVWLGVSVITKCCPLMGFMYRLVVEIKMIPLEMGWDSFLGVIVLTAVYIIFFCGHMSVR